MTMCTLPPHGRLAPSPTGFLHLGNAWSFLWAWLWAKSVPGGSIILRMEDIDPQRSRSHYAAAIEEDLRWLGLVWDGPVVHQSMRHEHYAHAMQSLRQQELLYPCYCTRKELRTLAGAPHVDDSGAPYPGLCAQLSIEQRALKEQAGRKAAWRLRCAFHGQEKSEDILSFNDVLHGEQRFTWQDVGGDFALCRSDGVVAYQLAVVVDDAAQGVTQVLRGADILVSTPRQLYLQKLLGFSTPSYAHVPLLLDVEGERLAKRHGSLALQTLRQAGVSVERILGLLAHMAGYERGQELRPIYLEELRENFSFSRFACLQNPQDRILKAEYERFLHGK